MRVWEGQNFGALTILIASLAIYGGALLHDGQSLSGYTLPWGDQRPGMIAAEVAGSRDADGIYFLPKENIAAIMKIINREGGIGGAILEVSDDAALVVSLTGEGAVKLIDMPAIGRLALGLPVDVNRASVEDLSLVPGIGERMAMSIVQRRQMVGRFTALSDLTSVSGIKERKLNSLKKYLTIGSSLDNRR